MNYLGKYNVIYIEETNYKVNGNFHKFHSVKKGNLVFYGEYKNIYLMSKAVIITY